MKNREEKVYFWVSRIPKGKVLTYGDVAHVCDISNPRFVGYALHNNPDFNHIPCHRVVHADGSLANAYAFGGEGVQRKKLESEGVIFRGKVVDLLRSRWQHDLTPGLFE